MAVFPSGIKTWTDRQDLVDFMTAAILNDDIMDEIIALQQAALRIHFGDGSDGAVDLDGTNEYTGFATRSGNVYTLARDVYAAALTVRAGVTLKTNGYKIFAVGTVTIESSGVISNAGEDGGNSLTATGGNAGASAGGGSTKSPPPARAGGDGVAYAAGEGGAAGADETYSLNGQNGVAGAAGGNGNAGSGGSGGSGGVATPLASSAGGVCDMVHLLAWRVLPSGSFPQSFGLTAGNGGAGGGGATCSAGHWYTGGGGGGGGGNGGYLVIVARYLINEGTISVAGGDGGDGANVTAGDGGDGAGGNGGIVALIVLQRTGGGTIDLDGGLGGANDAGPTGLDGLLIEL